MYPQITILTGRGCPNKCAFCKWPQTFSGHLYRKRSIQSVVDELAWIEKNLPQIKEVMIEDATFSAAYTKDRVRNICKKIIDRKIEIGWVANSRADVDYKTLSLMKRAGYSEKGCGS